MKVHPGGSDSFDTSHRSSCSEDAVRTAAVVTSTPLPAEEENREEPTTITDPTTPAVANASLLVEGNRDSKTNFGVEDEKHTKEGSEVVAVSEKKIVRFGMLDVWEFPVTLGDNPSVAWGGPPIRLDYGDYETAVPVQHYQHPVEAFEQGKKGTPRGSLELRIPATTRREWILSNRSSNPVSGPTTEKEISHAETEVRLAQNRRIMSYTMADSNYVQLMLVAQSVGRKLKRLLDKKEHPPHSAEAWIQQYKLHQRTTKKKDKKITEVKGNELQKTNGSSFLGDTERLQDF